MLTAFLVFSSPYVDVTNNFVIDGSEDLSLHNDTKYSQQLDNIKSGAYDDFQDSTSIGSTGENTFDKLGALIESGFGVASQSLDTAEDSTELIKDVQADTSNYVPAFIFTGIIAIIFLVFLFGLLKLITGR